jgi:hypothetical protein
MRLVGISWYLCGLFALAFFFVAFVVSFAPGAELFEVVLAALTGGGTIIFAVAARLLSTRLRAHWVHQSARAIDLYGGFAAILTILVFHLVIG